MDETPVNLGELSQSEIEMIWYASRQGLAPFTADSESYELWLLFNRLENPIVRRNRKR